MYHALSTKTHLTCSLALLVCSFIFLEYPSFGAAKSLFSNSQKINPTATDSTELRYPLLLTRIQTDTLQIKDSRNEIQNLRWNQENLQQYFLDQLQRTQRFSFLNANDFSGQENPLLPQPFTLQAKLKFLEIEKNISTHLKIGMDLNIVQCTSTHFIPLFLQNPSATFCKKLETLEIITQVNSPSEKFSLETGMRALFEQASEKLANMRLFREEWTASIMDAVKEGKFEIVKINAGTREGLKPEAMLEVIRTSSTDGPSFETPIAQIRLLVTSFETSLGVVEPFQDQTLAEFNRSETIQAGDKLRLPIASESRRSSRSSLIDAL